MIVQERMKWMAALIALALVVLTACGNDDEPVASDDGDRASVDGNYRSVTVTERGDDNPGSLVFEENGFVTGHDGCNRLGYADNADPPPEQGEFGLRYEVDGQEISFEGDFVGTRVACDDPDVDRFHAVLSGTVTWEIEASNLTLTAGDGSGVTYTAAD